MKTNINHKIVYKPTRQSNAIGMAFFGIGAMLVSVSLFRWKVSPYLKKKRAEEAEKTANFVFEHEQKSKEEGD